MRCWLLALSALSPCLFNNSVATDVSFCSSGVSNHSASFNF
ncbi:hypothetical protein [Bacteriophage sp.]|nr:hypothetical protein [Bacteriophage sp.]